MTDHPTFKTKPFTTSPATYILCLLGMWFKRYGLWVILAVGASALAGVFIDVRYLIAALMLILIIMPMLIAFIVFYYLLDPDVRRAVLPVRMAYDSKGALHINYIEREEDFHPAPPPETIDASKIRGITKWKKHIAIVLFEGRPGFILIPENAIEPGA